MDGFAVAYTALAKLCFAYIALHSAVIKESLHKNLPDNTFMI